MRFILKIASTISISFSLYVTAQITRDLFTDVRNGENGITRPLLAVFLASALRQLWALAVVSMSNDMHANDMAWHTTLTGLFGGAVWWLRDALGKESDERYQP